MRNLAGVDPKIGFASEIKKIQGRLHAKDPNITLDSFILSNTPLAEVRKVYN
jgi:hypothetical protein